MVIVALSQQKYMPDTRYCPFGVKLGAHLVADLILTFESEHITLFVWERKHQKHMLIIHAAYFVKMGVLIGLFCSRHVPRGCIIDLGSKHAQKLCM